MREAGVPLFSLETHRAAADFDVIAFNLSAELVYTNVLNLIDLAGLPVRAAERQAHHPLVVAGGHCAFNPEPLADFVDAFVLGRRRGGGRGGQRCGGRIPQVGADGTKRRTLTGQDLLRALAQVPGVYVPVVLRGPQRAGRSFWRGHPPVRRDAGGGREANHRRSGRLALSTPPARAAHRGRARPAECRDLPRLHPGLPVLPGRDDHPTGARAAGRAGSDHGVRRPAAHRLRRGGL